MQQVLDFLSNFPAGLATGIIVTLLGLAGKYFLDYRLQSRRVSLEEKKHGSEEERAHWHFLAEKRQEIYSVVGSKQAGFTRSAVELYDRLSNLLEDPNKTRPWLLPRSSLQEDGYYLREFSLRLYNFYVRGRLAQDAINSLPVELAQERVDLTRLYTFVNLANALVTHTLLFTDVEENPTDSEIVHLFTGTLARLNEMGLRIWQENDESLPIASFHELYDAGEKPLLTLRNMLTKMYAEDGEFETPNLWAALVLARLAGLRMVLAAYLSKDHTWVIAVGLEERTINSAFTEDLRYASALAPDHPALSKLVQRNVKDLIARYRCEWLPVGELSMAPDSSNSK